jgi:Clp amino terminal domain, pathogenicity island component
MPRRPFFGFSGHDLDRFDKFTERARNVMNLAQEEAQRFNHNYIGTEHLLLGLVREGDGVAAKVLSNLDVDLNKVRASVEHIIGRGDRVVLGDIGLTPRSKKVIELAVDEARRMNHRYIGTEHILLGLVREGEGIAAGVLESLGVNLEKVRTQTIQVLSQPTRSPATAEEAEPPEPAAPQPSAGSKSNVVSCRLDDRSLEALDTLVESGVRTTRSDAAAWLIAAGIDSHKALFDRLASTIQSIRQLRLDAQAIANEVVSAPPANAEPAPPADSGAPPQAKLDDAPHEEEQGEDDSQTPPQPPVG